MAMKITRSKTLPIGVDLGTTAVKMAQLRTTGDDVELLAAGIVEVPRPVRKDLSKQLDFLGAELQSLVKASGVKGSTCILSLPAQATVGHPVRIPNLSPEEIAGPVRTGLSGELHDAVAVAAAGALRRSQRAWRAPWWARRSTGPERSGRGASRSRGSARRWSPT